MNHALPSALLVKLGAGYFTPTAAAAKTIAQTMLPRSQQIGNITQGGPGWWGRLNNWWNSPRNSRNIMNAQSARRQHFESVRNAPLPTDYAKRPAQVAAPQSLDISALDTFMGNSPAARNPGAYQQLMNTNLGGQTLQQHLANPNFGRDLGKNVRSIMGPYGLPAAMLGGTYLAGKGIDATGRILSPAPTSTYPYREY